MICANHASSNQPQRYVYRTLTRKPRFSPPGVQAIVKLITDFLKSSYSTTLSLYCSIVSLIRTFLVQWFRHHGQQEFDLRSLWSITSENWESKTCMIHLSEGKTFRYCYGNSLLSLFFRLPTKSSSKSIHHFQKVRIFALWKHKNCNRASLRYSKKVKGSRTTTEDIQRFPLPFMLPQRVGEGASFPMLTLIYHPRKRERHGSPSGIPNTSRTQNQPENHCTSEGTVSSGSLRTRRFWATDCNREWVVFLCNLSSHLHIHI